jgi:hypothetical protein
MTIETDTIWGPDWATSYLINGDDSGISLVEKRMVDAWLKREGITSVLDVQDEPRFTWHYRLWFPEANAHGGTVVEYLVTFRKEA